MHADDLKLVLRTAIWMPQAGLVCFLAATYGIGTGTPQGRLGIFYFAPFLATWPLLSLSRSADVPKLWQLGAMALAGAAGAAAMAVGELLSSGTTRAGETVADPIHFADLALGAGFLALIGSVYTKGAGRWIYLLAPAAATLAILLSGTRGAVIALLVMVGTSFISALVIHVELPDAHAARFQRQLRSLHRLCQGRFSGFARRCPSAGRPQAMAALGRPIL